MAKKKWIAIPGGRIKRWKKSRTETRCEYGNQVPPHWYRNHLNRKERRRSQIAINKKQADRFLYVHPGTASWYW